MALTKLNYTGQGVLPTTSMPTGSVLQVKKVTWTSQTQITTQTFTDVVDGTFSFTPLSASSTLKISPFLHIYLGKGGSTEVGGAFQIVHNGSVIEVPNQEQYRKVAGSGTAIFQLPHSFSHYVASANTNARVIKAQGRCLLSGSEWLVNKGTNYTSHIEVMEIKG
tara:strand:- start:686 stop:1180 length:495 start_codon:yes stop_codon:yes gene_type:complete